MRQLPVTGRTYTRTQWEHKATVERDTKIDGYPVMVNVDYSCEGVYGPLQKITACGYTVTVWHRDNSLVGETVTVRTRRQVPAAIRRLLTKVRKHCVHPHTRELSASEAAAHGVQHFGMCYHVEQCLDCKAIYAYDSSG